MSPPLLSRKRSDRRRDSHHLPFPTMAPVSIPDGPPKDTTPTQSFQIPSATAPSSLSPTDVHDDPLTGDSATVESPPSQALSAASPATKTPPAREHSNPETGYLPPAQTPDTIRNAEPALHSYPPTGNSKIQDLPRVARTQSQGAGPSAASPAAPPESPSTETGHPQPNSQVDIGLQVLPHDADSARDVEAEQQQQPARLDEEAWREGFWPWCRARWTCHQTAMFMAAAVAAIAAVGGVVYTFIHSKHCGTSMATNRQ